MMMPFNKGKVNKERAIDKEMPSGHAQYWRSTVTDAMLMADFQIFLLSTPTVHYDI